MVFACYDTSNEQIVGISACVGGGIARNPGEPLEKLISRGHIQCDSFFLHLVYDASVEDETPLRLPPLPTPAVEPVDPFALAGIGKTDLKYLDWWQPDG